MGGGRGYGPEGSGRGGGGVVRGDAGGREVVRGGGGGGCAGWGLGGGGCAVVPGGGGGALPSPLHTNHHKMLISHMCRVSGVGQGGSIVRVYRGYRYIYYAANLPFHTLPFSGDN